jgi:hypothetical protein
MRDEGTMHGASQTEAGSPPSGLLESFLPSDRRAAVADGGEIPDRVEGAALFAGISGFTPLTEALLAEHGPQRGAEELNRNLDLIYEGIVGDLAVHHGAVLYFSGDAITCWLDGDDGERAVQCAIEMQETMRSSGTISTPDRVNEELVYDNKRGAGEDPETEGTVIGGGSIKVHTPKGKNPSDDSAYNTPDHRVR